LSWKEYFTVSGISRPDEISDGIAEDGEANTKTVEDVSHKF
jgi:hypothetical protein